MPSPRTPSVLGELALRRLNARAAAHAAGQGRPVSEPGRHLPARELDGDVNALVDMVAVTESYFADRLAEVVPAAKQPSTWYARGQAWRDRAGVDIAADPRWRALLGFVEARNALQHGLGRLTDMQLDPVAVKGREPRRAQVLRDLTACGLVVHGDRVIVRAADVDRCLSVCLSRAGADRGRASVRTSRRSRWRGGSLTRCTHQRS